MQQRKVELRSQSTCIYGNGHVYILTGSGDVERVPTMGQACCWGTLGECDMFGLLRLYVSALSTQQSPSGSLVTRKRGLQLENTSHINGEQSQDVYYPFGRPGAGAPCRTDSGTVITGLPADPDVRFQKQLKKEVDRTLVMDLSQHEVILLIDVFFCSGTKKMVYWNLQSTHQLNLLP